MCVYAFSNRSSVSQHVSLHHNCACKGVRREEEKNLHAVSFSGQKFSLTTLCYLLLCGCEVLDQLCMMSGFPTEWLCETKRE